LRSEEYKITIANSGVDGLKTARRSIPDLVILDVIMPGMDGYTVCREMRADPALVNVPVLFLTAKVKDDDRITGFTAGADDYLCKPFNIDELILRVRAILRRTQSRPGSQSQTNQTGTKNDDSAGPSRLIVGNYILDTRAFVLHTPHHGKVSLTPVQFDLLYHLMSHPGQVFSPLRLLDEVWDYPSDTGSPDLVRVHIKKLRERVEADPQTPAFILTVPGYGYKVSEE